MGRTEWSTGVFQIIHLVTISQKNIGFGSNCPYSKFKLCCIAEALQTLERSLYVLNFLFQVKVLLLVKSIFRSEEKEEALDSGEKV